MILKGTKADDLVFRHVKALILIGKVMLNLKGTYQIRQKLSHGAYKLEEFDGQLIPKGMKEDNLVFRHVKAPILIGKIMLNLKGTYQIRQKLSHGAYKLEELDGQLIRVTWNSMNLRYYYN